MDIDPDIVCNIFRYFEETNIDISTLDARSVTQATASASVAIHQDVVMQSPDAAAIHDNENSTSTHAKDREPSHDMVLPPGLVAGPGEGL